jgi:hypothetical protein
MTTASRERDLALALCGGVGGAKRVSGLSKVVPQTATSWSPTPVTTSNIWVCTRLVLNRRDRRAD